ncbi:MAG: heavy metal-associated domain-containing protein [Lachnospiraceae bacterium]|nr:heavy metal-associated domain-containing protein [Lachnospiraceae bacterium]
MKNKFNVTGMTYSACQAHIKKSENKLDGVINANENLLTNSMVVEYDENSLSSSDIIKAVQNSGYGANLADKKTKAASNYEV